MRGQCSVRPRAITSQDGSDLLLQAVVFVFDVLQLVAGIFGLLLLNDLFVDGVPVRLHHQLFDRLKNPGTSLYVDSFAEQVV